MERTGYLECSHCGLLADGSALERGDVAAILARSVREGPFVLLPPRALEH